MVVMSLLWVNYCLHTLVPLIYEKKADNFSLPPCVFAGTCCAVINIFAARFFRYHWIGGFTGTLVPSVICLIDFFYLFSLLNFSERKVKRMRICELFAFFLLNVVA